MSSFFETIGFESLGQLPPFAWAELLFLLHAVVQLVIVVRVVMSKRSVGAALAWIMIVFLVPFVGIGIYLLIGELKLGSRRMRLVRQLAAPIRERYRALDQPTFGVRWHGMPDEWEQLSRTGENMLQVPTLSGNLLELLGDWNAIFDRMIKDIDSAGISCDFEFYIWQCGGRADEVVSAIERAVARGVVCRDLVDAIGSQAFLRSSAATRLRTAGVVVQAALPGGLWRLPFVRFDLRLHRKIVLIDDVIGWTGSLNMVDPRFFKKSAGVGEWVDAMVRIEGPSVEALAITFQTDWYIETMLSSPDLPDLTGQQRVTKHGESPVQVLPSGPVNRVEAIERILITSIYAAKQELVITTPYFVPSESLQMALTTAAQRGVKVIIILPAKVDSLLVRLASSTFKGELLDAGVFVAQFHGGLLHTKSVTIDKCVSLFGSLNMDPRSFRLNFEITLAVYDDVFTQSLRELQQSYLDQSELMDAETWHKRSRTSKFGENLGRLVSPLL
ncbi:MAG: cardiolipin synthase [Pirellula sp.]